MGKVRFRSLPGVGSKPGPWRLGSVTDVLLSIPYFPSRKVIPSLGPMNDLLASGREHAGMSGGVQWKPVQLAAAEYELVAKELLRRKRGLIRLQSASWVHTMEDWQLFLDEHFEGIPPDVQRPHLARLKRIRADQAAAIARKDNSALALATDEEIAEQLDLKSVRESYRVRGHRRSPGGDGTG